ncbi:MAG: hypothetical protein HQK63_14230 [Desulfamplus sp.]|nr:hypothetical protein [Desulfamplus sp.]
MDTLQDKQLKQKEALLRHREKLLRQLSEHRTEALQNELTAINEILSEVEANLKAPPPTDRRAEYLSKQQSDHFAVVKSLSEEQLAFLLKSDEEAQTIWGKIIQSKRDKESCSIEQASKMAVKEYPHLYEALRGVARLQAKYKAVNKNRRFDVAWRATKERLKCSTIEAMRKAIELFPEFDS